MYSEFSPQKSKYLIPPKFKLFSSDRTDHSNPKISAKTRIVKKNARAGEQKMEERSNFNICESGVGKKGSNINTEFREEIYEMPYETTRNHPSSQANFEFYEEYENHKNLGVEKYKDDSVESNDSEDCNCKNCRKIKKFPNNNYEYEFFKKRDYENNIGNNDNYKVVKKYKDKEGNNYIYEYFRTNENYDDRDFKGPEKFGKVKDYENNRTYNIEKYEKIKHNKDFENFKELGNYKEKSNKNESCLYCNNYDCVYCQKFKNCEKNDNNENNEDLDDNNCEQYYMVKSETINKPIHKKFKTNVELGGRDCDEYYKKYTLKREVVNRPKKYKPQNEEDFDEEYYNNYEMKREVMNRANRDNYEQNEDVENQEYNKNYKSQIIKKEVIEKPAQFEYINNDDDYNKRNCDEYYKHYSMKKKIKSEPLQIETQNIEEYGDKGNFDERYKNYIIKKEIIKEPVHNDNNKNEINEYYKYSMKKEIKTEPNNQDINNSNEYYSKYSKKEIVNEIDNKNGEEEEVEEEINDKNQSFKKDIIITSKTTTKAQPKSKTRNYESYQVDNETNEENTFGNVKKVESVVDNFKYKETKCVRNPKLKALVVHKRMCSPTKQVKYIFNSGRILKNNKSTKSYHKKNSSEEIEDNNPEGSSKLQAKTKSSLLTNKSSTYLIPKINNEIFKKVETNYSIPQTQREVYEETVENYMTKNSSNNNTKTIDKKNKDLNNNYSYNKITTINKSSYDINNNYDNYDYNNKFNNSSYNISKKNNYSKYNYKSGIETKTNLSQVVNENEEYIIKTRKTKRKVTPYGEDILEDKTFQTVEVYPKFSKGTFYKNNCLKKNIKEGRDNYQ